VSATTTPVTHRRSLLPLWVMIAVFALPGLAAWFFFLNPQYLPASRSNRGELIEQVIPLLAEEFSTVDRGPFDLDALRGKWTLVGIHQAPCAEACRAHLVDLRQIRLALGESRFSVERLAILVGSPDPAEVARLGREFAGMHIALLERSAEEPLLRPLGDGRTALDRVYLLDPMGRLMMRYAADAPAQDTLKDLERLLKASKNWIKGAQYGHR
jgi:cytochrome oxidase Cu insertion factor (SCO1/SenC/PrrC family)